MSNTPTEAELKLASVTAIAIMSVNREDFEKRVACILAPHRASDMEIAECGKWIVDQWERGNLVCHTPDTSMLSKMRKLIREEQK